MKKYPIVTLCGSTKFKDEFYQVQKELTLKGHIVISVGFFGHSGDAEVLNDMDEGTKTQTKIMFDDMHKSKIDMADEIYVVNPGGYIGDSTWSEICYANMLGKHIESMESIDRNVINKLTKKHIDRAEELAWQQLDVIRHSNGYYNLDNYVFFVHNRKKIVDPWISVDAHYNGTPWADHKDPNQGVEPFKYYGKKKMARFIESIVEKDESIAMRNRREMTSEIQMYCKELNLKLPKKFPNEMTDEEMEKWLEVWDEFDPFPELN